MASVLTQRLLECKMVPFVVFFGALFFTLLIKVRCHNILPKWIHRKWLTSEEAGRQAPKPNVALNTETRVSHTTLLKLLCYTFSNMLHIILIFSSVENFQLVLKLFRCTKIQVGTSFFATIQKGVDNLLLLTQLW